MRAVILTLTAIGALLGCGDDNESNTADPDPAVSAGEEAPPAEDPLPSDEPPPTVPEDGTIVIVPGQSIGPIRIGMTRAEVDALGVLLPHPQYSAMTIPLESSSRCRAVSRSYFTS